MDSDDDSTYTHFVHREQFFHLLEEFLTCRLDQPDVTQEQSEAEERRVGSLGSIVSSLLDCDVRIVSDLSAKLDHYLPLPTLLDPHLQHIVPPILQQLRGHFQKILEENSTKRAISSQNGRSRSNTERLARVGKVVSWIVKVRGRKAVSKSRPEHHSSLE